MKDTIYFRHDFNASSDPKMIKLRIKYGREGYGLFRGILEYMRNNTDVSLSYYDLDTFVYQTHYEIEKLKEFLEYCCSIFLLHYDEEDKVYYSKRLQEDVAYMKEKSDKAREAVMSRWEKRYERNTNVIPNSIVKDSIVKYIKLEKGKETEAKELLKSFIPEDEVEKNQYKLGTLFELMQTGYKVKASYEGIYESIEVVEEYIKSAGVVDMTGEPLWNEAYNYAKKMRLRCEETKKTTTRHMSRYARFLSDYKK